MNIFKKIKRKRQEKQMIEDLEIRLTFYQIAKAVDNAIKKGSNEIEFCDDENDNNVKRLLKIMFLNGEPAPGLNNEYVITSVYFTDADKTTATFKITSDKGII